MNTTITASVKTKQHHSEPKPLFRFTGLLFRIDKKESRFGGHIVFYLIKTNSVLW